MKWHHYWQFKLRPAFGIQWPATESTASSITVSIFAKRLRCMYVYVTMTSSPPTSTCNMILRCRHWNVSYVTPRRNLQLLELNTEFLWKGKWGAQKQHSQTGDLFKEQLCSEHSAAVRPRQNGRVCLCVQRQYLSSSVMKWNRSWRKGNRTWRSWGMTRKTKALIFLFFSKVTFDTSMVTNTNTMTWLIL